MNEINQPLLPPTVRSALHDRCRERVTFGASVDPGQAGVLARVIDRMLESPTARDLSQQFFDEGGAAVVNIVDQATESADLTRPDAQCEWRDGTAYISLRGTDLCQEQDRIGEALPAILAHEVVGHGLWQARAEREGVGQAMRHHKLEEIHARLVGWLVDIELDDHISSDAMARHYLDDPDRWWAQLKLCASYYAFKFSSSEMCEAPATLVTCTAAARNRRDELVRSLSNSRSWPAVVDHFVDFHGLPEQRVSRIRQQLAEDERNGLRQVARVDAVIAELDLCVERFRAEADGASERYLRQAADHPLFVRLSEDVASLTRRLRDRVDQCAHDPFAELPLARRRKEEQWRNQVDFAELRAMYVEDLRLHPEHWQS